MPKPAPAAPLREFLKGQLHAHSSGSYDAEEPPERVLEFYAERGYDFVAITDHNRVTLAEPPASAKPMLVIPAVELTQNSKSCKPAPSGQFRCLFHTGAMFLSGVEHEQALKLPFQHERFAAFSAQFALAERLGGVGVVLHPHFHFAVDPRLMARLVGAGARLFELVNAALDAQHPGGSDRAEARAEGLWDNVLSRGLTLFAIATDDAHHFSQAASRRKQGKSAYEGDRAWVWVRAERSLESLRQALLEGDFYASTGVELSRLDLTPARLSLQIRAGNPPWVTRFIGSGGRLLAEVSGESPNYTPLGTEGYVRAVVRDAVGKKAWTQPLRLP